MNDRISPQPLSGPLADLRARETLRRITRREFLRGGGLCLGGLALGLLGTEARADTPGAPRGPHFAPKAKRVIHISLAGAPSQFELFEHKPLLAKLHGKPCPESLLKGRDFAFIRGTPAILGPQYPFAQYGQTETWVSDRLPHFAGIVDEVCMLRAVSSPQINHAPGQLLAHTGFASPGNPSLGSWAMYGLGEANRNLPGYVVLLSGGRSPEAGKPVWGSGFMPSVYQGLHCRSKGAPVLYLNDPAGVSREARRASLDALDEINRRTAAELGDAETLARIEQYELAFRMQVAAPEAFDLGRESAATRAAYGAVPGEESFANNCLLARRLAERGVRFIQLFDHGWDSHGIDAAEGINAGFRDKCAQVDRPVAALIKDLKQRGLLEDTLVIWGGEFGRTPMRETRGDGEANPFLGRDHHSDAFTLWLAGGGVKPGFRFGETDEFGYTAVRDGMDIHDLHATLLHLLGFDHTRLTYRHQGRDFRLTDVSGRVVKQVVG